jgi:hypothetical protein
VDVKVPGEPRREASKIVVTLSGYHLATELSVGRRKIGFHKPAGSATLVGLISPRTSLSKYVAKAIRRGEPMAKLRAEPEQQAYERRMKLLYEQLRNDGELWEKECAAVARENPKIQGDECRASQSHRSAGPPRKRRRENCSLPKSSARSIYRFGI